MSLAQLHQILAKKLGFQCCLIKKRAVNGRLLGQKKEALNRAYYNNNNNSNRPRIAFLFPQRKEMPVRFWRRRLEIQSAKALFF